MAVTEAGALDTHSRMACACSILNSMDWSKNPRMGFYVGLRCALDDWDVLRTAIIDGWAGSDRIGHMHRNELHGKLTRYFGEAQKEAKADAIADMLIEFMSSKFNCDLDDDSIDWVADLCLQLYQDCKAGDDFSGLQMMVSRNCSPPSLMAIVNGVSQLDYDVKCSCQAAVIDSNSFRPTPTPCDKPPGESAPELADDDGWQMVSCKKSSRKRAH